MQVDQARSAKTILADPKIVDVLRAISFHCWDINLAVCIKEFWNYKHARAGGVEVSESIFQTLTPQEQAELLSVAFVDVVSTGVIHRSGLKVAPECTQHNVEDILSLAEVTAAFQQVPPESCQMCLSNYCTYKAVTLAWPCLQMSNNRLVDTCYTAQTGCFLALAADMRKQLVR